MSALLGQAVAWWATDRAVEERTRWIEWDGGSALGCRALASHLSRSDRVDGAKHVSPFVMLNDRRCGAGQVDGDRDHRTGEEALVELPGPTVDIEGAVLAHATPCVRRECRRERRLVDGARGRGRPHVGRRLAEQTAVRSPVVMLVEEREQARLDVVQ